MQNHLINVFIDILGMLLILTENILIYQLRENVSLKVNDKSLFQIIHLPKLRSWQRVTKNVLERKHYNQIQTQNTKKNKQKTLIELKDKSNILSYLITMHIP